MIRKTYNKGRLLSKDAPTELLLSSFSIKATGTFALASKEIFEGNFTGC